MAHVEGAGCCITASRVQISGEVGARPCEVEEEGNDGMDEVEDHHVGGEDSRPHVKL